MLNKRNYIQENNENIAVELTILSVIGDREEQQDSYGYTFKTNECLVAVCDGMGGHSGGKRASTQAIDILLSKYLSVPVIDAPNQFLARCVTTIDEAIAGITDDEGNRLQAGSTMATVIVRNQELHWTSVGDSRIYILRDEEFVQITEDHNYQNYLCEQLNAGKINQQQYDEKIEQGEALVSFLGVNGLPQIDMNDAPFQLKNGDRIILMSDGLYKILSDEEIKTVLVNFKNIKDAVALLEQKAQKRAKKEKIIRDNMTVAILRIK